MHTNNHAKKEIEIVLPCYNEESTLRKSFLTIFNFLENTPYRWKITIAENGSTDKTKKIAKELLKYKNTKLIISKRGRGEAIKKAWSNSNSDILIYMDIDLSTKPEELPKLIKGLENSDISIGSRLLKNSDCKRSPLRTFISKSYNKLVKLFFKINISDTQCGFKAIKKETKFILKSINNNGWFFDTELLVKALRNNLKIKEVPISWNERSGKKRKSKVKIIKDSLYFLTEIFRLKKELSPNKSINKETI